MAVGTPRSRRHIGRRDAQRIADEAAAAAGLGHGTTNVIDDHSDVDTVSSAPSDTEVLTWVSANGRWEPAPSAGGSSDLDGLTDVTLTAPAEHSILVKGAGAGDWVDSLVFTGDVTGDLTGNADTATSAAAWTTARDLTFSGDATGTLSAVDGSATVDAALTVVAGDVDTATTATTATNATNVIWADAGTEAELFITMLSTEATGAIKTDTELVYNASTNALTATTFIGALTGNADTATTATVASTVTVDATTADDTSFVMLAESASGNLEPQTDTGLLYAAANEDLTLGNDLNIGGNIRGDGTGMTISGGDGGTEDLTIESNSADLNVPVNIDSPVEWSDTGRSWGSGSTPVFIGTSSATHELDAALLPQVLAFDGVVQSNNPMTAGGQTYLFDHNAVWINESGTNIVEGNYGGSSLFSLGSFRSAVDFRGDDAIHTLGTMYSFAAFPKVSATGASPATTVNKVINFVGQLVQIPADCTVDNCYDFEARRPVSAAGTYTSHAGFVSSINTDATNNTHLLLGTNTIPSGDWGIYNTTAHDNFIEGEIFLDTDTGPSISAGSGAASGTPTLGSIYLRSGGGSGVDGLYVYDTDGGGAGWRGPLS